MFLTQNVDHGLSYREQIRDNQVMPCRCSRDKRCHELPGWVDALRVGKVKAEHDLADFAATQRSCADKQMLLILRRQERISLGG